MVIHHLKEGTPESKERLLEILRMKTEDPKVIASAIGILNGTGSLEYARRRMYGLVDGAKGQLEGAFGEC